MLTCTKCGESKSEDSFAKSNRAKSGRFCWCKECKNEYYKGWRDLNPKKAIANVMKWRRANPERIRHHLFIAKLKKYGITRAQFETLVNRQNGKCAICQKVTALGIDHDHLTDTVRELLCQTCNKGLGLFHDDAGILLRAANYINSHKAGRACGS